MILAELKTYLAHHQRAGLLDLAHRFGASPEALRGMLAALERKGPGAAERTSPVTTNPVSLCERLFRSQRWDC